MNRKCLLIQKGFFLTILGHFQNTGNLIFWIFFKSKIDIHTNFIKKSLKTETQILRDSNE